MPVRWYVCYRADSEELDTLVEPVLVDEVSEINKDFVNMSGDVYEALESCRWYGISHPANLGDSQLPAPVVK